MKYIIIILLAIFVWGSASAQFTGTDSLRNYNNRYITTNPATAFTNNRLNTLLRGIIDFIDTARAGGGGAIQLGIDTIFAVNDSTIRYRKNGVFRQFTLKGVYESRRKVDTIYKSNDTTLTFTVNGTPRTVIIPGGTNLNLATADQTATGNRNHNWNNHWLYLNNIKAFGIYQDQPDANHPNNRFITQILTDSTINDYPLRLLWGIKNINDDFTDSLHFELTSTKNLTYLYHYTDAGAKMIEMDWDPYSFYPSTKIYANGNGKNGYYEWGASVAEIQPNDSTRVKLVSTPGATKMVTARAESGGMHTLGVADIPDGADSTIFATKYGVDTAKTNIREEIAAAVGTQTLQQVFNQGSLLNKHDTIYQGKYILATNGQFINKDTNRVGENQSIIIFGTSVDQGLIPPFTDLPTRWGIQAAGNLGLFERNRAISGTTLIHRTAGDSCMFDRLYTIPVWNPSIRYIVIGTYPLNDVLFHDSTQYRTGLSAIIDSLHINRNYPLASIIVLNGTPAPVRGSNLPLLATAAIHVAMEKGVRYFDSYNYLLPESANVHTDNLHLSLKGQINLATGLLNATNVFDSATYIMTNVLQVQKGLTNNGFLINRGSDSTLGRLHVGGNFNLLGNFERAATFLRGVSITGDATLNREWNLFYDPAFNEKWGIKQGGTSPYHTWVYASGASSANQVQLGSMSTGGVFTPNLTTGSALTKVFSTAFEVAGTSLLSNNVTMSKGLTVTGDATLNREWNLFSSSGEKWGIKMGGTNPYFTDIYSHYGSGASGVRLGWMASDGTTFTPVLSALKSGNVLIGTTTDNAIGKLQVNGKATITTVDSSAGPANMLWIDPITKEIKKAAVSSGADGNGFYTGSGSLPIGTTTVTQGNNILAFTSTQASSAATSFANTGNGNTVSISSTGSAASLVVSNSGAGAGAQITSNSSNALNVSAATNTAAVFSTSPATTNNTERVVNFKRTTSGTAADNMAGSIGFQLKDAAGTEYGASQFTWTQTNATNRTTSFGVNTLNAGVNDTRWLVYGDGKIRMNNYGINTFSVTPTTTPVFGTDGSIGERIAPKIYTALLTQSGTGAPTATVLGTNEIGTIVWTRNSAGSYTGTLTSAFTANKTWAMVQKGDMNGSFVNGLLSSTSANSVSLTVTDNAGSSTDNFTNMSIRIEVYP